MNDEILNINLRNIDVNIIKLRNCFTAGYTMPQFCIDNNIKKPLFVAHDERFKDFLWEVYVQFQYDKRMAAQFSFIRGKGCSIFFDEDGTVQHLEIKNLSTLDFQQFDKIIFFVGGYSDSDKFIFFDDLKNYFIMRTYVEIPLLSFAQKNPGIKLFIMPAPCLYSDENNSEIEKNLIVDIKKGLMVGRFKKEIDKNAENITSKHVNTPYDIFGYSNKVVSELLELPKVITNSDGSTSLENNPQNSFMQVKNGKRFVPNQPESYRNTIYFVGNCVYYGYGVSYDKAIPSCLQKLLNEKNLPYCVENESQAFNGRFLDTFYNLNKLPVKAGDIVFVTGSNNPRTNLIPTIDVNLIFKRPHNYGEVFLDAVHINENGHKALADYIFKVLVSNNFFRDTEFEYPPPPAIPQIRYTNRKFNIPPEFFTKCGVGRIQEKVA